MAAPAVVEKKKKGGTGEAKAKWSIWLNQSGTLSFGRGSNNEIEIAKDEYEHLKPLPVSERVKFYDNKFTPPPPVEVVEAPAAVDAAPAEVPVVVDTKPAEVPQA